MIEYVFLLLGIIFLIKGSDWLVDGASALSHRLGISTLIIGLTVVAFGTSAPELLINIMAATGGSTDVAFGNIVGSNIANLLLVLGITAAIRVVKVRRSTIWEEIPFEVLSSIALIVVANDFIIEGADVISLTRTDGLMMFLFFGVFIYYAVESAKKGRRHIEEKRIEISGHPMAKSSLLILGGAIGLYFGGKWTVDSAVLIAQGLGLSEFFISATILALGTSLPELVTSITAAARNDLDLAVGNIIGSNVFNIFWILGVTAMITPIPVPVGVNVDLFILLGSSLLLFAFMFIGKKHHIQRWQGGVLLILYASYIALNLYRG